MSMLDNYITGISILAWIMIHSSYIPGSLWGQLNRSGSLLSLVVVTAGEGPCKFRELPEVSKFCLFPHT